MGNGAVKVFWGKSQRAWETFTGGGVWKKRQPNAGSDVGKLPLHRCNAWLSR